MRNERNDRQAMLRLSNIERMEIISLAEGKTARLSRFED